MEVQAGGERPVSEMGIASIQPLKGHVQAEINVIRNPYYYTPRLSFTHPAVIFQV